MSKIMYIPKIKTENLGKEKYIIADFDLDLSEMKYAPIANDILVKNLLDETEGVQIIKGNVIDYDSVKPELLLVGAVSEINEIDYEKCPDLIGKIVKQFLSLYRAKYKENEVRNICLMYRKDIVKSFKNQLIQHLAVLYDDIFETVQGIETIVCKYSFTTDEKIKDIHEEIVKGENIKMFLYDGAKKAVTTPYRFDSNPERKFVLVCENSPEVVQWLRPASEQFNITYNKGKRYEPDFVVETSDLYYLVEVKARNMMNNPDVVAKKERAISYCRVASEYNLANKHKAFKYLFIPDDEISQSSSFNNLKGRFLEEQN